MHTAGIICEYNPFHEGHAYQISACRAALGPETGIVCLMSGNFVQRGEPAIYPKHERAKAAIQGGADLVLELPITVAVNAAGFFAAGAVACMERLGVVDTLCFGTERGTTEELAETAKIMGTPEFDTLIGEQLKSGVSYPRARQEALGALGGDAGLLDGANAALGLDYIRALLNFNSAITPLAIPRDPAGTSATALRQQLRETEPQRLHTLEYGERALLAVLKTLPEGAFAAAPFGAEGLWSLVRRACRRETAVEDILSACKSKRYTMSRLKRMLLCLFLGLSEEDMGLEPPYLRVLAFNERGREILRDIKKQGSIDLVSGAIPKTQEARTYFGLEARATDLYGLFLPTGQRQKPELERQAVPVFVQKK